MDIKKITDELAATEATDEVASATPRATDALMKRIETHGRLTRESAVDAIVGRATATQRIIDAASGLTSLSSHVEAATRGLSGVDLLATHRVPSIVDDMTRLQRAIDPFAGVTEALNKQLTPYVPVPDIFREDGAIAQMNRSIAEMATRFSIPEFDHLSGIAAQVSRSMDALYGMQSESITKALSGLQTPWLDSLSEIGSAAALARVQGIGHLLGERAGFDRDFTALLRTNLGDWRDPITLPPSIIEYPTRVALYEDRGFDRSLIDIPDAAFDENLDFAGLAFAPADNGVDGADDDEAQRRTNELHSVLQRFEIALRRFIDRVMTEAFGADWPRRRLPNNMLDAWLTKQQQDSRGDAWRAIDYADFTDYERIITRADNFREAFAPYFTRIEFLRESMQRLSPGRLATMHARPLGRDDVLLATIEIRRLMLIIGNGGEL